MPLKVRNTLRYFISCSCASCSTVSASSFQVTDPSEHNLHGEYSAFSKVVVFPCSRFALLAESLDASLVKRRIPVKKPVSKCESNSKVSEVMIVPSDSVNSTLPLAVILSRKLL